MESIERIVGGAVWFLRGVSGEMNPKKPSNE